VLGGSDRERGRLSRLILCALALAVALAVTAPTALAHIERASYWPDPAADSADGVPTGGAVPDLRPLFTALSQKATGDTRVVCQGGKVAYPKKKVKRLKKRLKSASVKRKGLKRKIRKLNRRYERKLRKNPSFKRFAAGLKAARANGYELRPSEPRVAVSKKEAKRLKKFNMRLLRNCGFNSIQDAVTASGNNDRVVIMPGIYTEPKSRSAPTNDPKCDGLEETNDRGQTGANSYRYISTCPNDQNLIAVIGRTPGPPPPQPPLPDRRVIPDAGPCIRCNLQIEGSGVSPDDVIIDAGRVASGNGSPVDSAKDVGIKADRADGFVFANATVRHVAEHGIYAHEVDGYRLERFKTFQTEEYGVLTFTADHGLIQDCAATTSGDAGIYPGSAPDTGEQTTEPGGQTRYNTEIRRCDMFHNTAGYSGTAANAVWFHDNDVYDNALGFTTDVFTAAGHPGFPQDTDLIENNDFYSNNFNPYVEQPADNEVIPTIPVPVGTALWIAGGNNNLVRNNRFWDNWRRGTMLFAVPDALVCPPGGADQINGCNPGSLSTSYRNRFQGNSMGRRPNGTPDPNGTDFWWDAFVGNTGNCWYDNTGPDGTRSSLTAEPPLNPVAGTSLPLFLPEDCATSAGFTGIAQETELVNCLANFDQGAPTPCTWFTTPPEP
jgi:hypothetical protein